MAQGTYLIGNTYYHYANPSEELERNFELMKGYGVNIVRTNEIWPGWSVTERQDNVFYWEELDDYILKAKSHGLSICLGIGINDTPAWLYRKIPELRFREYDGTVSHRRVQSADFNHIRYREYMERFIVKLVERYRKQECVVCWQFGNEIRYNVDYCDSEGTRQAFRRWLRKKYQNQIEKLNLEWGTFYTDFNQIYPYKSIAAEPTEGNSVHCINTLTFQDESIAEFIQWGVSIVKKYSNKPVFHNNFNTPEHNPWAMAAPCDVVCMDIYASTYERPGYYNGLLVDTAASIARQQKKDWWIGETSAGQYGTYNRQDASQALIETCIMEQIAAGSKAIFYFRHKAPKWEQPHKFTGSQTIYRRDETPMEYADTCLHIKNFIESMGEMLLKARIPRPKVGVYFPCINIRFGREAGYEEIALESAAGARNLWSSMGIPVELLPDGEMFFEKLKRFSVIHIPVCYLIPESVGAALKAFVQDGGTLITEARAGYVDGSGLLYRQQPGASISEICGISEDKCFGIQSEIITVKDGNEEFSLHCKGILQTLRLNQGTGSMKRQVCPIAWDSLGNIAGSTAKYGKGRGIYLGFAPSLDFSTGSGKYSAKVPKQSAPDYRREKIQFWKSIAASCGVYRSFTYKGEDPDVSVRYMFYGSWQYVFFFHYGESGMELQLPFPVERYKDGAFHGMEDKSIYLPPFGWDLIRFPEDD